jgi:hypothetical protein
MNANTILKDDMSLEEKLAAIDAMMASQTKTVTVNGKTEQVPVDPSDALMCEGCQ